MGQLLSSNPHHIPGVQRSAIHFWLATLSCHQLEKGSVRKERNSSTYMLKWIYSRLDNGLAYIVSNHPDQCVPSPVPDTQHIHAGNAMENLRIALSDSLCAIY